MFFSVVIPSHKRKKLLSLALHSLQEQRFKDFEVIVVATEGDEAFELAKQNFPFAIRFLFVPDDPSQGRSASAKRNFGAQKASAEWIAFIDDDCLASPDWLHEAFEKIKAEPIQFLEGAVHIPKPDKPTFPYKGIRRLSRPGGYQTCNMFYRRKDFLEVGGFDPNFPYYLEDTDLAWSFLDNDKHVDFAEKAVVSHPVPEPVPSKMLESAFRIEKIPYLYKKHPKLFKQSQMRVLPRPYLLFLVLDLMGGVGLFLSPWALSIFALRLMLTLAVLLRMMWGCTTTFSEFSKMYYYLLICPIVSFVYLIKGNIRQGVWLFLR